MFFQFFLTVALVSILVGSAAAAFDEPDSWTEVVGGASMVIFFISFVGFLFTVIWWV